MSTRKKSKSLRSRKRSSTNELSLVVLLSTSGMTLIGYLVGETAFNMRPHPAHWGIALLGGLVGWVMGRIYYHFKGDIA